MNVHLRYFASLREAVGLSAETLVLPAGIETTADLRRHLAARGGIWAEALAPERALRVALDQDLSTPDARLHEGAEVAFFPPVTGG